jgi:hypothetical protein
MQQTFQITSLSDGGAAGGGGGSTTTVITKKEKTQLPEGIIIDPLLLVFIAIIGSISATAAGTSYVMIKRIHRIRKAKKQKLLNRCIDVLNLN